MISFGDLWSRVSVDGRLMPFFKCVCVYVAAAGSGGSYGPRAPPLALALAKASPVLCLAAIVYLARNRVQSGARLVVAGLALSALGDALLVWESLLLAGMAAFAAAHAAYAAAWGLRPAAPALGLALQAAAGGWARSLRPPPGLALPAQLYAAVLAAAAWRGAAPLWAGGRAPGDKCAAAGSALFLVSDAVLGYGLFREPVAYQQVIVMSTYYAAQLFIALSALQPRSPPPPAPPAEPPQAPQVLLGKAD